MFGFNIAKEAEKRFTRWAMRRACKFFLKKKLGKYILGEIDLNQLDVQLSDGTIQLSDLALNVDYLNQKLGARAALIVQEGSIGSLLVTMPWKSGGCQVEIEELELVIAPRGRNLPPDKSDTSASGLHDNCWASQDSVKMEPDGGSSVAALSSMDVLEGVKTIAKMVKWLLSSFHVKIRKLIVALDPSFGEEHDKSLCRTLVLRIAEVECGTHISEDCTPINDSSEDNFLGLSRLTNFIKFSGAVLEFLHMDNDDNQGQCPCNTATTSCGFSSVCCQSNAMTPVLTSKNGGISGNLNLSIPWKNGSLDIRKVDADACIDPLELRFQPSTIACFIYLWDVFKDNNMTSEDDMLSEGTESVYDDAQSKISYSTLGSCKFTADPMAENNCSVVGQASYNEDVFKRGALLSDSHLISDWVGSQNDRNHVDPDFGASSMYQFFECFDELRSSHSALGNSRMWNWTCSVFSAITAASNLASGSLHNPLVDAEQQHVETNFTLTISQISLVLSFFDDDHVHYCGSMDNHAKAGSDVRYLGAQLNGLCLVTQVCPAEMNFDIKVEHVELDDYFSPQDESICSKLHGHCDSKKCHVEAIQKIEDGVEDALIRYKTSFSMATHNCYDLGARQSMGSQSTWSNNCQMTERDDFVKKNLLRTLGIGHCRVSINTRASGNILVGPISFTLKLPPLILWVNFSLVDLISDLLKRISAFGISSRKNASACKGQISKSPSASQGSERKDTGSCASSGSTNESVKGNIFLSDTRVILCFPYSKGGNSASYSFFNQFIALDFSFAPMLLDRKVEAFEPFSATSSRKRYLLSDSRSLHVILGNLHAYFIASETQDVDGSVFCCMLKPKYIAKEIMSIADGIGGSSVISMFWQDGALTGPWIVNKAKLLATDGTLRNSDKFMGKDCEFASVITVKDVEDSDIHTKQEIISSSGFFLHAKFLPLMINLEKVLYDSLVSLLQQLGGCLSSMTSDTVYKESVSQGAILVEFDSVEVAVTLSVEEAVQGLVHKELSGSWSRLQFKIQKFAILSASDIGGMRDASFLWVGHREGNLLGSVTGVPSEELLLISCSNSCLGRGDGEGSNVLSPMFPGSDIIHLWHPGDFHSYTSVGMRCGTIVTRDGRLDWWDQVCSFFSSPCEFEQTGDKSLPNERRGSSFILNLADFALSYEPFSCDSMGHKGPSLEPFSDTIGADTGQSCFSCLLAASSLRLSNTSLSSHSVGEYKITVQELGLLLCPASGSMNVLGRYGADHLRMVGYRKIAQVPHFEAILRTLRDQFPVWEVECSDSHITLNTCNDTAAGLIQLCAQLQQLFAPDVEDALVHLQARWYNMKKANEDIGNGTSDVDASSSVFKPPNLETNSISCLGNLMNEICLDTFQLDDNCDEQGDYFDEHLHRLYDGYNVQPSNPIARDAEKNAAHSSFTESLPALGLENSGISFMHDKIPHFIEEYFLSDLQPLSGSSLKGQPSKSVLKCKADFLDREKNRGWYGDASLRILDDHILDADEQNNSCHPDDSEASTSYANSDSYRELKGRVLFKNMKVLWRMYGGSDWKGCQKNAKLSAVASGRDATVCLEISLSGLKIQYDIFPDGVVPVSRLSLTIEDFSLNDCSKDAPWKLVLGYYQSKSHPRKSSSQALKLELECVRPDPSTPLEEYRLRVALLPMHLQLHQSQLDFLINFFGGESSSVDPPMDNMRDTWELGKDPPSSCNLRGQGTIEEALLPFFQQFDIWPFLIRVDYSPRHVDLAALRRGKYVELINIVPWKGVELQLKHVHAVGVYGWNIVCETMIGEWLEDISQNQMHKLLKGLPPIRSLVAVGSSAAKLVTMPMKSYRKDRRLLKGMQRGTISFLRSISLEAIGLGVHLAAGTHEILLQAEYILMSIPPSVAWLPERRGHTDVRSNQPKDALQGVKLAYESINDGLNKSASALVRTPLKKYQRGGGVGSALATVVKGTPVAAIAPASAAVRAMHCALLGVRNSLDPERKKESLNKYLGPTQHRKFR